MSGKYVCWIYTRQSMAMTSSSTIVMSLLKLHPSFYPYLLQEATPQRGFLDQMMPSRSVGKVLVCCGNVLLEQTRQN